MKYCIIIFVVSLPALSFADSLSFKLPALNIGQIENGKNVWYEFENSTNTFFVKDSFLVADPKRYNYKVNINVLNQISIKTGTNLGPLMVLTFGIGGLLGAGAAGGFHSNSVSTSERIIGALIGGAFLSLVSGGIALLISHDNEYVLSGKSFIDKKSRLLESLKKILKNDTERIFTCIWVMRAGFRCYAYYWHNLIYPY